MGQNIGKNNVSDVCSAPIGAGDCATYAFVYKASVSDNTVSCLENKRNQLV